MREATFEVVGPHTIEGRQRGETFDAELTPVRQMLVDGGHLKIKSRAKLACPACLEQGKKRPPKFDSLLELRDHYAKDHPAFAAPTNAGEEE